MAALTQLYLHRYSLTSAHLDAAASALGFSAAEPSDIN